MGLDEFRKYCESNQIILSSTYKPHERLSDNIAKDSSLINIKGKYYSYRDVKFTGGEDSITTDLVLIPHDEFGQVYLCEVKSGDNIRKMQLAN